MKLTGNLKEQVEKSESRDEKRNVIEQAGMILTDDELDMVTGGMALPRYLRKRINTNPGSRNSGADSDGGSDED